MMDATTASILSDDHPSLLAHAFVTAFPRALGEIEVPPGIAHLLSAHAGAPLSRDEPLRLAVRDMLREGGYKPTGRGKPASEYLARTAERGPLNSINLAVDACNGVSLHSGLPISVVDLDLALPPFRIAVAPTDAAYVFNPSGQEIRLSGLVCLFDRSGACANAVKDAQRTKTSDSTTRTLSIVWGVRSRMDHVARTVAWYRSLLEEAGAHTDEAAIVHST